MKNLRDFAYIYRQAPFDPESSSDIPQKSRAIPEDHFYLWSMGRFIQIENF
jgi:hypothetical protein